METVKVELEVSKEAYELGKGLSALMINIKKSLADGFQPGSDLPAIVTGSLSSLFSAVQGAEKIGSEASEDAEKFSDAIYCGLKPGIFALVKK